MNIRAVTTFTVVGECSGIDKSKRFCTGKGFFVMVLARNYDSLPSTEKHDTSLVLVNIIFTIANFQNLRQVIYQFVNICWKIASERFLLSSPGFTCSKYFTKFFFYVPLFSGNKFRF